MSNAEQLTKLREFVRCNFGTSSQFRGPWLEILDVLDNHESEIAALKDCINDLLPKPPTVKYRDATEADLGREVYCSDESQENAYKKHSGVDPNILVGIYPEKGLYAAIGRDDCRPQGHECQETTVYFWRYAVVVNGGSDE